MRGLVSRSWTRVDHDLDDHDGTDMESRLQINKPRALARTYRNKEIEFALE